MIKRKADARHSHQKYFLTVKGLALLNGLIKKESI